MRALFLIVSAWMLATSAQADPPDAQAALADRRGLLQIDARCRLLQPGPRAALEASALQARGALLRGGWTTARVTQMEQAIDRAARERTCNDARTQTAAADAREAYDAWATINYMSFPGWSRAWVARRVTGPNGWRLSQDIDAPVRAAFGVRELQGRQTLTLIVPGANAASARLRVRDTRRSPPGALDLANRMAYGLSAGAPGPAAASQSFTANRVLERRVGGGGEQSVYTFSDATFRAILALDPRESIEIDLIGGRVAQRLYVEVGDLAAARTFLTLRAD